MKFRSLLYVCIGLLFAGIGSYFAINEANINRTREQTVSNFLDRSLPDIQGKMQPLSQWKGKILIVNFWATWCAPCVDEIPALSRLQNQISGKNAQIIGIGVDSPSNIAEFSSKNKVSYPLYVAGMGGSELSQQFGDQVGALPFTVLITSDGKVKNTYLGKVKIDDLLKDLALVSSEKF